MKLTISLFIYLFIISPMVVGQARISDFDYKRELSGVSGQWHSILLPDDIFGKLRGDLQDIRIFGITEDGSTIEAPYLLRISKSTTTQEQVPFRLLNKSHNSEGYYYTFETPEAGPVNRISLNFSIENFDWLITLQGSQNLQEWYIIRENIRFVSIKNETADFRHTNLAFPLSQYRYFRLMVQSEEEPGLTNAILTRYETSGGSLKSHPVAKMEVKENDQTRQTEIDVRLSMPVPVSRLTFIVSDSIDYFRPVTIRYLADSLQTEQGWRYSYRALGSDALNSAEESEFSFNSTTVRDLSIIIDNHDNRPLSIGGVEVKGYIHELVVRFTEDAGYILAYGNNRATMPNYDIGRFTDAIPLSPAALELGEELEIIKPEEPVIKPLFEKQVWLWGIMAVIIVVLGWFSMAMLRKA